MADSGNGCHLLYRIDLPVNDGGLVRRVLKTLAARFDDDAVEIDRKVHDAPRITKLYGTKACKGDDAIDRPHRWTCVLSVPGLLAVVSTELLEGLAAEVETTDANPADAARPADQPGLSLQPAVPTNRRQALARAYIAHMPPAIEGQGGDKQTFAVACRLVVGFNLSVKEALPVLNEYNLRCQPPWEESELIRKLENANKLEGERGKLLGSVIPAACEPQSSGASPGDLIGVAAPGMPYLASVPDFMQVDWHKAQPGP